MLKIIRALVLGISGVCAIFVGYLLWLTGQALRAPRTTPINRRTPQNRFLILIPAHNEEKLITTVLENLGQLDYPTSLYAVHVVADNCTDQTANLARAAGAIVHERFNEEQRGKGYALQWLLQELWAANEPHDAIVILDADTVVSQNFLRVMDVRLLRGERAIQAYYAVRDPDRSWGVSLRYAALAVLHYLRPLGRTMFGGSAGLKGNGMVFAADILRTHQWSASVTEDIEYHMTLLLAGERVTFAPDAVVWAEMPGTLAGSKTQNVRWEAGRVDMARKYVPALLKKPSVVNIDATMEHLIPPFSILAGASAIAFVAEVGLWILDRRKIDRRIKPGLMIATTNILGQIVYLIVGLRLVHAPRQVYEALIYAPALVVWKIWLYVRVLIKLDKQGWIRTARD
jgi:cellulose synthase/poly-beta-1,6-N-acetylglucosamine synthase-like glycosyltransferase